LVPLLDLICLLLGQPALRHHAVQLLLLSLVLYIPGCLIERALDLGLVQT
jgi:hypothetical protein